MFVRCSAKKEVTTVFKRNSFTFKFIGLALVYNIFHGILIVLEHKGQGDERNHFVLYHACLDPWNDYSSQMFTDNNTIIQTLVSGACTLVNIVCNLFLYRFLEKHRNKSSG